MWRSERWDLRTRRLSQGLRPSEPSSVVPSTRAARAGRALGSEHGLAYGRGARQELGELVDVYLPMKVLIAASSERLMKKRE
jgi:hypothetical protein